MPLRVGINFGNALLAMRGPRGESPSGVVARLAIELGASLRASVEWIPFDSASAMADAAKDRAWDVAFLAPDPARAGDILFTAPYLEIEATYLVPAGSPIQVQADVDRAGVRIATWERSAYDLYLRRAIQHAQLVGAPGIEASVELFRAQQLEALAGLRPLLLDLLGQMPNARILGGRFTAIQQAIGAPAGRDMAPLEAFVRAAKASGLVARAIEQSGMTGRLTPVAE